MFKIRDLVKVSRDVKAGLSEDGPEICKRGTRGVIVDLEPSEPDGVCVLLSNRIKWWFKPNQLEVFNE